MTIIRTFRIEHPTPAPPSAPFTLHGAATGPEGGAIVSARHGERDRPHVIRVDTFPATLQSMADAIERLLADDPTCRVVVDGGLHGLDLWRHLGGRRTNLRLFEARAETRRTELAGALRSAWEADGFTLAGALKVNPSLRKAISDATREDAAERPLVVALSLAVINRRRVPRIG